MRRKRIRSGLVVLVSAALVVAGCQTAGQSAGTGAVVGGLAGGIIGHQSGHALEGALIGAAVGAAAGWAAHKIVKNRESRQAKTADDTADEYNYTPDQGFQMDMREGSISPGTVNPGDTVVATYQYATLGTGADGVNVKETCYLRKGTDKLADLDDKTVKRMDGTWENLIEFQVPDTAEAGQYTLAERVSAKGQTFQKDLTFQVTTEAAQGDDVRTPRRIVLVAQAQ